MDLIKNLIDFDIRHEMFRNATRFIDYELIEGDILEFGVYTGRSLALLSYYHNLNKKSIHAIPFDRNIIGFDSFQGLPSSDNHPRWKSGMFNINHSYHPLYEKGIKITPDIIYDFFKELNLTTPILKVGDFTETLSTFSESDKSALIHIDCDLYLSTKNVLDNIEITIQDGTMILFDDWFNFKGNKDKGEQKAFHEFVNKHKNKWNIIEYQTYATFGKSFIFSKN